MIHTVNPFVWASQLIRPILPQVCFAITSTVLAVFGSEINSSFRALIRKRHFIVRVSAFVLLVAFGYGALNFAISHLLSQLFMKVDNGWLSPLVVIVFVGMGIIAEERRQI